MTVRKVRTPEGEKFYGLPIGSPIASAVVHAKNLAAGLEGISAPQGGLDPLRTPTGLKVHETTLVGPATFFIESGNDDVTYAVPAGSLVIRSKANPEMVYVRTPDGEIHVFNEDGEIDLGAGLTKVLTAKFGPDFRPSSQYTVVAAKVVKQAKEAPAGWLANAAPGSLAVDAKGHTVFVKNDDGSWTHDSFGVKVSAADLQQGLDSGELTIKAPEPVKIPAADTTVGAFPLKGMNPSEVFAWMAEAPTGAHLSTENSTPEQGIVKQADGSWKALGTGNTMSSQQMSVMAAYMQFQGIKAPEPEKIPETKDVPAPDLSTIPLHLATQMSDLSAMAQQKIVADQDPPNVLMNYTVAGDLVWNTDSHGNTSIIDPDGSTFPTAGGLDAVKKIHPDFVSITHHPGAGQNRPYGFPQKVEWIHGNPFASFGYQHSLTFYRQDHKTGLWHSVSAGGVNEYSGFVSKTGITLDDLKYQAQSKVGSNPTFWFPETGSKKNWTQYSAELIQEANALAPKIEVPEVKAPGTPTPSDFSGLKSGDWFRHTEGMPGWFAQVIKVEQYTGNTGEPRVRVWSQSYDNTGKPQWGSASNPHTHKFGTKLGAFYGDQPPVTPVDVPEFPATVPETKAPATVPETKAPATDVSTYGAGDIIAKYGHLRNMDEGTTLSIYPSTVVIKNASGGWQGVETGNLYSPNMLANKIIAGDLYFQSHPKGSPDEQITLGTAEFKKSDVTAAIAALEAHTGFQISYGFKAIPDNPLADKDTQNAIKTAAVAAFPDLKPKPAFVAYLKAQNGIEAPVHVAPVSTADTIHFGAAVPEAKSIQGMNGGDFTVADVQDAIAILEAFHGKAFKAELNKKGNALGVLNPNDLVGFDKDKTVVKEKFLLLLQQKLLAGADTTAPQAAAPVIPEPEKIPETKAPEPVVVEAPEVWDGKNATQAPAGSTLTHQTSGTVYTKNTYGTWDRQVTSGDPLGPVNNDSVQYLLEAGKFESAPEPVVSEPVVPEPITPAIPDAPDLDAKTVSDLDDAEIGSTVTSVDGVTFTKDSATMWSYPGGSAADWSADSVVSVYGPFSHIQPPAEEAPSPLAGMKTFDMKTGDVLTGYAGTVWTKQEDNSWSDGKGYSQTNVFMNEALGNNTFESYTPAPVSENKKQTVAEMAIGSSVKHGGTGLVYTKTNANFFTTTDGGEMTTSWVQFYLDKGDFTPVESAPAAWDGEAASTAPVGTTATMTSGTVYTKTSTDQWGVVYAHNGNTATVDNSDVQYHIDGFEMADHSSSSPTATAAWDGKNVADAPVGQQVVNMLDRIFTKNADGSWTKRKDDGTVMAEKSGPVMQNLLDMATSGGSPYTVLPHTGSDAAPETASWDGKNVADALPGQVLTYSASGMTFTKNAEGTWTRAYPDGTLYSGQPVDNAFIQPLHDQGKLNVGSVLADVPPAAAVAENKNLPDPTTPVQTKFTSAASMKNVSLEHSVVGDWIGDTYTYTKTDDGMWTDSNDGEKISTETMQERLKDGWYLGGEITVLPQAVVSGQPVTTEHPKNHGMLEANMGVGDVLAKASYSYTKISPMMWKDFNDGETVSSANMQYKINNGEFLSHTGIPAIKQDPAALKPGKYQVYGAKAYMVVQDDHTGLYVTGTGTVSKMTTAKVTANFIAGMNYYTGEVAPDAQPVLLPKAPKAKPDPNAPKKAPLGPVTLPDGVYFLHAASGDNETEYTIVGDTVQISKNGTTAAPVPTTKIKAAFHGGKIVDKDGNSVLPVGHTGAVMLMNRPTTVAGLVDLQKALTDPDDHTLDAVLSYDVLQQMTKLGVSVNSQKIVTSVQTNIPDSYSTLGPYYQAQYNSDSKWHVEAKKVLLAHIDTALKNADTHIPEADTAALFDWGPGTKATMPLSIASALPSSQYYYLDSADATALAKKIAAEFGGGKILIPPTSKGDKQSWAQYFENGNFAAMYNLESSVLGQKGKSHPAGKLHPGHPSNVATNNISWGPVVPGEMAASDTVPGDWSQVSINSWSAAEIDNYLISAQMQNPTSLTLMHKRQWVEAHKSKNKKQTDKISSAAALWKVDGKPEQSPVPVWTDGVVPAKEYDFMFDGGPYPTAEHWTNHSNTVSVSWALDHWSEPGLAEYLTKANVSDEIGTMPLGDISYYDKNHIATAVSEFFGAKYDAYQAELLKPVYTLGKKIEGDTAGTNAGTHAVYITTDQFDRKYVFKPVDNPATDIFRSDVEVAANNLGISWGFPSTPSKVVTIGNQTGILMDFVPHELALVNKGVEVKLSGLTDKQLGQIASEHVLDWILDNDDTHRKNLLIGSDGNMVGIDKGRGLYIYGNWFGMTGTAKANSNTTLVYSDMYDDIRSGTMTQQQASAAYLAAIKSARKIQKADDAAAEALVRDGVKNRTKWSPNYKMTHYDQTQAPQNADALVKAFLDRKHGLVDDVEKMWTSIFNASSYDKPEIPAKALGDDHFSGWGEDGLSEHITATKVWGTSALHASPSIANGQSLLWSEKNQDGSALHKGSLSVLPLTQKKILGFLVGKAPITSGSSYQQAQSANVFGFPDMHPWKSTISAASKDASKHVADKTYTEEKWTNFEATADKIEKDLAFWSPDLTALPNMSTTQFPSGTYVPLAGLYQYKMALLHYQTQVDKVRKVKEEGLTTTPSDFSLFQPIAIKTKGNVFEGPAGEKWTELVGSGTYMHVSGNEVSMGTPPSDVLTGADAAWTNTSITKAPVVIAVDPIKYAKVSAHTDSGSLSHTGVKTASGGSLSDGQKGQQYDITLPTGEVITFRNGDSTNTYTSQSGQITFTLSGDAAGSLERVQNQLAVMGLDATGAEEEDAETVYWRAMFYRVLHSNGGDAKVSAARNKLKGMTNELVVSVGQSVDKWTTVEAIGLSRTPAEERAFWHDLAVTTWSKPTVDAWLGADKHLPTYRHMDLADTSLTTGKPVFQRIDVDMEKVYETGTMLAIGNKGKDTSLLNYFDTGGMMSTEERIRVLGKYKQGESSESDQGTGGAGGVFTRLAVPGSEAEKSGAIFGQHVAYWSPTAMNDASTYSFTGDNFGRLSMMENGNKFDPVSSLKNNTAYGNETLVSNTLSIFDHLEIMVFDSDAKRLKAIQKMKDSGLAMLRGLPIEERLILRTNLNATLKKVRAQWLKK